MYGCLLRSPSGRNVGGLRCLLQARVIYNLSRNGLNGVSQQFVTLQCLSCSMFRWDTYENIPFKCTRCQTSNLRLPVSQRDDEGLPNWLKFSRKVQILRSHPHQHGQVTLVIKASNAQHQTNIRCTQVGLFWRSKYQRKHG